MHPDFAHATILITNGIFYIQARPRQRLGWGWQAGAVGEYHPQAPEAEVCRRRDCIQQWGWQHEQQQLSWSWKWRPTRSLAKGKDFRPFRKTAAKVQDVAPPRHLQTHWYSTRHRKVIRHTDTSHVKDVWKVLVWTSQTQSSPIERQIFQAGFDPTGIDVSLHNQLWRNVLHAFKISTAVDRHDDLRIMHLMWMHYGFELIQ